MRRFQQLSFCFITALAISLTSLCGCDLGTYSKRSTDYLQANPGGMKKEMKKEKEPDSKDEASRLSKRYLRICGSGRDYESQRFLVLQDS